MVRTDGHAGVEIAPGIRFVERRSVWKKPGREKGERRPGGGSAGARGSTYFTMVRMTRPDQVMFFTLVSLVVCHKSFSPFTDE
jgi:hypothetical protein